MLARRLPRPALAIAAALATAAAAGVVPAQGATTAGWQVATTVGQDPRITYLLDPGGGNAGDGFVATGANDAWSVWGSCAASCGGKAATIVEHWNGTAWHRVATAGLNLTSTDAVAASSATDAWLFEGYDANATARHWDGTAWTSSALPPWAIRFNESGEVQIAAADFGASDVWLFTLGQQGLSPQTSYAGHFNGTSWVKRRLPAIPDEVDAVARNDIWALGTPGDLSGSGGLWMIFTGPRPAFTEYFAHLTSGGTWTRTVIPATTGTTVQQASVITAVPGTASAWAAGELIVPGEGSGGIVGAIWRH
jgi:hypothetical protein